jgi:hypothetical protein
MLETNMTLKVDDKVVLDNEPVGYLKRPSMVAEMGGLNLTGRHFWKPFVLETGDEAAKILLGYGYSKEAIHLTLDNKNEKWEIKKAFVIDVNDNDITIWFDDLYYEKEGLNAKVS